jgi:hypothetical protein
VLERGGQFVLLGSAPDPKIQAEFNGLAGALGGENAAFCFSFDEPLSHLIYAGCDIILVPSMFEPCGLTQVRPFVRLPLRSLSSAGKSVRRAWGCDVARGPRSIRQTDSLPCHPPRCLADRSVCRSGSQPS